MVLYLGVDMCFAQPEEGELYTGEAVWGRQWVRQRSRMNDAIRDKVAQLRTSRLSLRQAASDSVAIQITQSAFTDVRQYTTSTPRLMRQGWTG